jgi:hypothetical protein
MSLTALLGQECDQSAGSLDIDRVENPSLDAPRAQQTGSFQVR